VYAHNVRIWRPQEAEHLEIRLLQGSHRCADLRLAGSTSIGHFSFVSLVVAVSKQALGTVFELFVVSKRWLEGALILAFFQ